MLTSRPNGAAPAVALETLKGYKTLGQLSSEFGIHAQMITTGLASWWKRQALDGIPPYSRQTPVNLSAGQREQIVVGYYCLRSARQGSLALTNE